MISDTLFALFIAGLVAARFRCWLKYSPPAGAADIRLFSRRLTRTVYLVLYLIIGAKQIMSFGGALETAGGPARHLGVLEPASQVFLVYGLIALVLIRVLAYLTWRQYRFSFASCSADRSPASSPGLISSLQ